MKGRIHCGLHTPIKFMAEACHAGPSGHASLVQMSLCLCNNGTELCDCCQALTTECHRRRPKVHLCSRLSPRRCADGAHSHPLYPGEQHLALPMPVKEALPLSSVPALQVEDDTSSANNGFSGMGGPSPSQLDSHAGEMPQMSGGGGKGGPGMPVGLMTAASIPESEAYGEEEANKKDTAAADDLRELAAKGVCAPLWRTNQPVQPVSDLYSCTVCMIAAYEVSA